MSEHGKAWEYEIRKGLAHFASKHGAFFWMRLADYRDWVVLNPILQAPHQPADFLALFKGRLHLLEAKSCHQDRFIFEWLKEHQTESLKKVEEAGGFGWILFSWRKVRPSDNFAIRIGRYEELKKAVLVSNPEAKSVKVLALKSVGVPLESEKTEKGKVLNLERVFAEGE